MVEWIIPKIDSVFDSPAGTYAIHRSPKYGLTDRVGDPENNDDVRIITVSPVVIGILGKAQAARELAGRCS